jgi:hypothetical protein
MEASSEISDSDGARVALVGCLLWLGFGKSWLGHLPGDIHFRRGGTEFYFPIVTCVLLSVVLSILLSIFRR